MLLSVDVHLADMRMLVGCSHVKVRLRELKNKCCPFAISTSEQHVMTVLKSNLLIDILS
jgi:hypothetical protein